MSRNIMIGLAGCFLAACSTAQPVDTQSASIRAANGAIIPTAQFDAFVAGEIADLNIAGMSIALVADGQIVHTATYGVADAETGEPVTQSSVFEAASLSKPVFAYLTLMMVNDGTLELDRPLHEYLPMEGFEGNLAYHEVTARMALSHRTGFPNWRWFDPAPPELGIERGTMYMKREPGDFGYSGEGYNYLAQVLAHLTGRDLTTLDGLYQMRITEPLGLSCSSFVQSDCVASLKVAGHRDGVRSTPEWPRSFPTDTPQTFGAAGRLHTNATDYARIMIAMMEGEGLPDELADAFFAEQSQVPLDSDTYRLNGDTAWGLGIAIEPTTYGVRYEHGGDNGDFTSGMMMFREQGVGYVFLTNSDQGARFNERLERIMTIGLPAP